ncbi:MAG: TonB-dependent siderophore receptor [Paracoccus sp. (in: a-proteobacteria)]|uniref:TonB-dependent siderophore receptor n=1 Tax=Paracoccus sp. TaxID=267 RepID=UPI0026DF3ACA|nr:TonB-dependent siderophore receptor [Paracoccus sp. (in: a-proteobacteria)]MDO5622813.1 TonB-dependent siderophore receptor [Paracoccus sp. (in: a-proteobacteria)]
MTQPMTRRCRLTMTTALAGVLFCLPLAGFAQDADDTTQGEVTVLEQIELTAAPATITEDSGSWTTEWMRSATGLVLSQRQTPQSTSAITSAQMEDRNITTVEETLNAATGITVQAYESDRINYYSRGFPIDAYQYDGVPIPRNGVWQFGDNNPDMALYDHVEIVRGANGLMQGAGEPGASVNFIRKRPTEGFRSEAAFALSDPSGARIESDISGPLNATGTVRGRLIGVWDKRDGTLDRYEKEKQVLFGAIDIDLTDSTTLNTSLTWQRTQGDGVTWGGLAPFYTDGSLIDWPKGASLGRDWTEVETERTEFSTSLEHVFDNGWTGRLVYTHVRNDMDSTLAWIYGVPNRVTGDGMQGYGTRYDGGYRQNNLTAMLNGDFQAFGRTHEFAIGAMTSKGKGAYYGYGSGETFLVNIYDLGAYVPRPVLSSTATYTDKSEITQYAIYGTGRFSLSDRAHMLAGARINWWDGETSNGETVTARYKYSGEITPYLGFTYDINDNYTAYGSIASIYKPQLYRDADGNYLDPTYGWNYELGVKGDLNNGAMQVSAAVFQTDQKDVADYLYFLPDENRSVYTSIDGTKTRGFELEAAGEISARWNVSAGYTYRKSEDRDGNKLYADQPEHTLKIATDYRLAAFDDRMTVGGAMRWQSGTDSMDFTSDIEQPNVHQGSYAVFDLSTSYDIDDETVLTLSVNNIFGKKYYATTGFYDTVVYGEPRTAELTLRKRF